MSFSKIQTVALAALLVGTGVESVLANSKPSHMKTVGLTSQPIGHYDYCKQYRFDCALLTEDTQAPQFSKKLWNDLIEVNSFSNHSIKPMTDLEAFNKEEIWLYPSTVGDCEDYVLMKRQMLMKRGWPASSLLITVVLQENGEAHAVLTVRTDKADYVLDNLTDVIMPWNETPYRYIKRQSTRHSGMWTDIADLRG